MTPVPTAAAFLATVYGTSFVAAPVAIIDSALTFAAQRTSGLYQTPQLAEQAVFLRAAIILLRTAPGQPMRKGENSMEMVWEKELRQLQRSGMIGLRSF